ncbi:sensor histidine kinase [Martelella mediterranea]|uniref:C4-dicarboxylate transport sensor protein DctB n=1 Tax=Martelella mediterranea DSM 17316 TaxID=1122214 RepID=A0A1U9Z8S8_9HYPH|nr:ATP-binding protein [Martelella mediterranea]AQZ53982.1 C4-dicarboxylate transport sensor protein DctB [Martelella mediterranea DSM 17316]
MDNWLAGRTIRRRFFRLRLGAGLVLLAVASAGTFAAWSVATSRTSDYLQRQAAETLAVQSEVLNGVLEKYRLIPPLLARQDEVARLFASLASDAYRQTIARALAEEITGLSGARDVAFFSADGALLAAARDIFGDEPAGRAELLKAARENRLGRTTALIRGKNRVYAFGAGVRRDGQLRGVVAVYVGFDAVERTWALSANPIFVSDNTGTIFLSNRVDWLLKPVSEIEAKSGAARGNASGYIDVVRDLPLMGWQLHVLGDRSRIVAAQTTVVGFSLLIFLLVGVIAFFMIGRIEDRILLRRRERAQALRLERAVRDRTKELSLANRSLSHEIEERIEAERELKRVQHELIQAAKLAGVGQMAAALSHEINQPLAAIETYAANTKKALALGRQEIAEGNLDRIAAMVARISELSGTLLSFSRKPATSLQPVSVQAALQEALILIRPKADRAGVAITVDPALDGVMVEAGRIRLSQVFVNLFGNAIDALEGRADGRVAVELKSADGRVCLHVRDNGPGIAPELAGEVFEPFFTTRDGQGSGLGLSIVYNIMQDFGGSVALLPNEAGAVFELRLKAAQAE